MPVQDPYAALAKPIDDPYASIATPINGEGRVRPAGLPPGVDLPQLPAHPAVNMQPSILGRDPNPGPVANFVKGVVKSIPGTMAGIAHLVPGASDAWETLEQAAQTHGTAQGIGKGVGNAAQFLIPMAGEEKLAAYGASKLPMLGEAARPLARIGASALGAGTVNKAQGGGFGTGALAGGVGSGIGMGLKALAPTFAESALRVSGNDRIYGRTLGRAILDDTRGILPDTITRTGRDTINTLTPELENLANTSGQNGARGSLSGARQLVDKNIGVNLNNRAVNSASDLHPIRDFLKTDAVTGLPLADSQNPTGLLRLKRGVDADFVGNWNPNKQSQTALDTAKSVYGNLADQFHSAAPGTEAIDQRISSLIPVVNRAERAARSAGITENVLNKFRTPTGALTGAIGGGGVGYERGGIPGALGGAAIGAIAPALIASPEAQMAIARGLNSNVIPKLAIPAGTGLGLQLKPKQQ